jgi:hypothetical protein
MFSAKAAALLLGLAMLSTRALERDDLSDWNEYFQPASYDFFLGASAYGPSALAVSNPFGHVKTLLGSERFVSRDTNPNVDHGRIY